MKGAFTYANLLTFGQMVQATPIQSPPDSYDHKKYRVQNPPDFYTKCIEPKGGRCAMFVVDSEKDLVSLQKFKDVVTTFFSISAKFHFMWMLSSQLESLNFKHPTSDFPQMVMLDPLDKLFAPMAVGDLEVNEILAFLGKFDTKGDMNKVRDSVKSRNKKVLSIANDKKGVYDTKKHAPEHVEL